MISQNFRSIAYTPGLFKNIQYYSNIFKALSEYSNIFECVLCHENKYEYLYEHQNIRIFEYSCSSLSHTDIRFLTGWLLVYSSEWILLPPHTLYTSDWHQKGIFSRNYTLKRQEKGDLGGSKPAPPLQLNGSNSYLLFLQPSATAPPPANSPTMHSRMVLLILT